MAADLREMQENQWVSEIRIDKLRLVLITCLPIIFKLLSAKWKQTRLLLHQWFAEVFKSTDHLGMFDDKMNGRGIFL